MRYAHTLETADISPGYRAPAQVDLEYRPPGWPVEDPDWRNNISDRDAGISSPYALDVTLTIEHFRYRATRVEVRQSPGGSPIGTGELARLPLAAMFRAIEPALPVWVYHGVPSEYPGTADVWDEFPLSEAVDRVANMLGPREGQPELVALLYRLIKLTHPTPTAELARRSEVNDVTVRRWLARAVKLNLLDQDERTR